MQSFKKSERLCLTRLKELLFDKGQVLFVAPFKVFYFCIERGAPLASGNDCNIPDRWCDTLKTSENLAGFSPKNNAGSIASNPYPAQVLISVPKKKIKKATERNHIKRQVKEAYRKNKEAFYASLDQNGLVCLVAFVYTGRQILAYCEVERKIVVILQKLSQNVSGTVIAATAIS